MKKFFKVFMVMAIVLLMSAGCSCKKDDSKASLQIGDMNATTYTVITMEALNKKIKNDDSFVLFVFQTGCRGCELFKPILENAIQERHLIIYAIEFWEIDKDHDLRKSLEYTPSIVVYDEGEAILKTDPDKNNEYFKNNEGFLNLLDKYTYMPTLYYINLEQLNNKIANDENFIVYYSRSSCEDCGYLNRNYLKKYLNSNVNTKHFYIIETDTEGIRYTDGKYDETQWIEFKNTYGLSNVNNPLGHGVGYVPTLQYYENGEIKEMMVYFNDGEYIKNEDNSYSVIINNSYYDDNEYIGETIASSEYREKLAPFYDKKLKAFLDTNLKKVD